ncbi:hypothetical protein [Microvirga lenta]|uniref:hypothetical protein n=1 Tax=Microvirga lenta TaxID=2881337 RepID=UPI001CFFA1C2|nr:hypothetical protein [Microvirga lenta]
MDTGSIFLPWARPPALSYGRSWEVFSPTAAASTQRFEVKTETVIESSERTTTVRYTPENYDAYPPAAMAWVDGRVIERNRDREAAAHALLLFPFVSGRLCPARGCGVDVAKPLRELFLPRNVLIEGVEMAPARIPTGTRTAIVCDGSYRSAALLKTRKADLSFRLSESAYTTLIGPRNVVVASNFGVFANQEGQLNILVPAIAAALLFCEDLGIVRLVLPVHDLTAEEAELLGRLSALLASVNISVETPLLGMDFAALSRSLPDLSGLEIFLAERHEHITCVEDLPDFWLAQLLLAQASGDRTATTQARDRVKILLRRGCRLSAGEQDLLSSAQSASNGQVIAQPDMKSTT